MRLKISRVLIFVLCMAASVCVRNVGLAQEMIGEMQVVYHAYKELQPYLADSRSFLLPANDAKLRGLLKVLGDHFHQSRTISSKFSKEPGFASSLRLADEMLDDITFRFKEGKKGYALWRLRSLTNNCIGCHTTYNVELSFADSSTPPAGLDLFQQGEFFFASRQFIRAENSFLQSLRDPALSAQIFQSLSKLLVLYVRNDRDPKKALSKISELMPTLNLVESEKSQANRWLESLKVWSLEAPGDVSSLSDLRKLVNSSSNNMDLDSDNVDTVGLLRASSLLLELLVDKKLQAKDKSEILYLLGFCYSKLQPFFVNELPEFYLEQCMMEFPGSNSAKASYELYKELVTLGYTGSGGTEIPKDIELRLKELHDLSYQVPKMESRI